jgi:long-chain acyl-CoA synthetase
VSDWLREFVARVEEAPDATALRVPGGSVTSRADLLAECERVRAALLAGGIEAGESVALFLPSGAGLIRAFFAVASVGAIAVPLSPTVTPYELPELLALAEPRVLVTKREVWERYESSVWIPHVRHVLFLDEPPEGSAPESLTWSGVGQARSRLESPAPNTIVGCHFTYKGLGAPLGALHRYQSYGIAAEALAAPHPGRGPVLVVLPFHQVYGLTASVITPLAFGGSLVLPSRFNPRRFLELVIEEDVRYLSLVPGLIPFLASSARRKPKLAAQVPSDLVLTSGGTLLEAELGAKLEEAIGVPVFQGYGLSETLPFTANDPHRQNLGSLGWPLGEAYQIEIRDADGAVVPTGQAGQIWLKGPTLMVGYRRRPRETARFLSEGWLQTGDLGHLDAQGCLHFLGRREPFTKIGGQMVDLLEVENVLQRHPAVAEACAFPQRGRGGQPELAAAVILAGRSGVRLGELFALARERLSPHKVPRRIKIYRAHYERFDAEF